MFQDFTKKSSDLKEHYQREFNELKMLLRQIEQ